MHFKDKVSLLNRDSRLSVIKNSPYWDENWYCSRYKDIMNGDIDPAMDFLKYGGKSQRDPGSFFVSEEYLSINPDVRRAKLNPLLHYEQWGFSEGRGAALADLDEYKFPAEAVERSEIYNSRGETGKHFVAVFASFSGDGRVADYVLYYLKGLREVCDYIVFVSDNPLFEGEYDRLRKYSDACICKRHREYDFGSYKRGFHFLRDNNILNENDSLIVANDSVYGPIYPIKVVTERFLKSKKDFYGLSAWRAKGIPMHIQSFFYIFSPRVYNSREFCSFIDNIKKQLSPSNVVWQYEIKFTNILAEAGFKWGTYLPSNILFRTFFARYELRLLRDFKYPVIKIKALQSSSKDKMNDILEYINSENSELYRLILPHIKSRREALKRRNVPKISPSIQDDYKVAVEQIRNRSGKIKAVFLVSSAGMFPAEGVMNDMLGLNEFDVRLCIIPDVRFGQKEMIGRIKEACEDFSGKYPFAECAITITDKDGIVNDCKNIVSDADVVFYSVPYSISYSIYNPCYAACNAILSVYVKDKGYQPKEWDNCKDFWRIYIDMSDEIESCTDNTFVIDYSDIAETIKKELSKQ